MLDVSKLYKVQKEALNHAMGKSGFCYFLEMGLGKTRVVLYEFNMLCDERLADTLFVVCPKSLIGAWEGEREEIGLTYPIFRITAKTKPETLLKELAKIKGPKIVVVNYEAMLPGRRGDVVLEALLKAGAKIYCALDESIRIKAKDSVIGERLYHMAAGLVRKSPKVVVKADRPPMAYRRVLSGGPAPQGPHDLWAQMRFVGIMENTTYYGFRNTYCRMGGWMGKQVIGSQNLDILRHRTGDHVFRARKLDWTDLPSKLPAVTREVEMLPEQRRAYLTMMHEFVTEWGDREITVEMAVTAKAKLAQISTGFMFDNDKNVIWLMEHKDNPKAKDLEDFMEDVKGKLIVFYHHRPAKEVLEWLATKWGNQFKSVFLESGMDTDEIERRKAIFNTDPECRVVFCQSSAHKYGHTLLGDQSDNPGALPCCTSYFFENTYNRDTRAQCEDRNHRHGQRYPVSYFDVAVSREDKLTVKALQKKEDFENTLLAEFSKEKVNVQYDSSPEW